MEITRVKITRELSKTTCPRCYKEITGTSDKMVKHNYEMHLMYCKENKRRKK